MDARHTTDDSAPRLHIVPPARRSLGDKLQELAGRAPQWLVRIEQLVDYILQHLRQT